MAMGTRAMHDGFRRWLISTTALTSMLLLSEVARAQFVGPMTVTSTQTINNNATVDSTAGSFEVNTAGNNQPGFRILGGASLTVLPSTFGTFITTRGANSPGISVESAIHNLFLDNLTIRTFGAGSDGILRGPSGLKSGIGGAPGWHVGNDGVPGAAVGGGIGSAPPPPPPPFPP